MASLIPLYTRVVYKRARRGQFLQGDYQKPGARYSRPISVSIEYSPVTDMLILLMDQFMPVVAPGFWCSPPTCVIVKE